MPAIMVTRCLERYLGPLRISDTQIISISPDGPALFGYEYPRQLTGRYMSDLQDRGWRLYGHERYDKRKRGEPLEKDYRVMVRWPDGSEAGQVREFGGFMEGVYGEEIYLTYLYPTREIDHGPTARTLRRKDCTVADLRVKLATNDFPLELAESFRHIIRECTELSSGLFAGKHFSPLDLALSDDVAVCWHGAKTSTSSLVRPRFLCEWCGWQWQGWAKRKAECTACGRIYRRYGARDKAVR